MNIILYDSHSLRNTPFNTLKRWYYEKEIEKIVKNDNIVTIQDDSENDNTHSGIPNNIEIPMCQGVEHSWNKAPEG